ncbi:M20 family metallopeptidase [Nocardioides sp. QY071]|uniref:M20 metallopeptidase family protein n=1 Tax=Nocardioides sp. QY071 TaxID=3044187 RepID=UPI00249B6A10|nr:M20 family metallopeptidase [Nocardioides sp. QY071]WGY01866.1 M20 family metallopeptidase [Nocardioides sp. QY071]
MIDRWQQAAGHADWIIGHRRRLHEEPEVGLALPDTHAYVAAALAELGLSPEVHEAAGVTAVVRGREGGRTVVLRADMDALPVHEETGLPFASRRDGAMHACGHDLHMAMLLGAARCLVEEAPRRDTVLVFQPGEESDRGAVPTLARHAHLRLDDAETFAIHVHATWPAGTVFHRPGVFMAAGDWFRITFTGPGAHASQPHLAGNPIVAGADVVHGLRRAVAELATDEHLVATVTESLMGNTVNVIPAEGSLRGTLRTLSRERRAALVSVLRDLAERAAEDAGLAVSVEIVEGYPPVVNDATYDDRLVAALQHAPVEARPMAAPSMVIEDYAYFLERWPGSMVYLGAQVPGHDAFNHAADAMFDEGVLALGAGLHLLAADGL